MICGPTGELFTVLGPFSEVITPNVMTTLGYRRLLSPAPIVAYFSESTMPSSNFNMRRPTLCWFLVCGATFALLGCADSSRRVVVYCAHDREFAEEILQEFGRHTGLDVKTTYDTEANKAVGLYED